MHTDNDSMDTISYPVKGKVQEVLMKRKHLIIVVSCILASLITFLVIGGILSVFSPEEHFLLTPEQKEQYNHNAGTILIEQQYATIAQIQRNREWGEVWPYILLVMVGGIFGGVAYFLLRYTRPVVTIASRQSDGLNAITTIPIIAETTMERQMVAFAPIVRNMALAQGEAQDKAVEMWRLFIGSAQTYRGNPSMSFKTEEPQAITAATVVPGTPTFRALLEEGRIAPGQPLIMGYNEGEPEYHILSDLKALGVGGLQGSGKTLSCAYLMGSAIYAYGAQGYLLDPHSNHPESLTSQLKPLIRDGYITEIPNFEVKKTLLELDMHINSRLNGQEPCAPPLVIMFDELCRIIKTASSEMLKLFIGFLERCTEETRKANVLFCGISPKWTAKNFGNHADIRRCLNSVLVHQMKLSEAKLLLEDQEQKTLLKQIRKPGDCVLVTDFDKPVKVSMPYCMRSDFEFLAQRLSTPQYQEESVCVPESPLQEETLLEPGAITQTIRELVADTSYHLQDIYDEIFTLDDMRFETFRKKYQQPKERPWKLEEQQRLSERLPYLIKKDDVIVL